jgi:hypothetical protein
VCELKQRDTLPTQTRSDRPGKTDRKNGISATPLLPDPFDDTEQLVPLLDAEKKPGYYPGRKDEYSYVRYRKEIWEVRNVKTFYIQVFKTLWATQRDDLLAYTATHGGPVHTTEAWPSQWEALEGGSHYLFTGLFPQYMLAEVQQVLDEFDIADDVFLRYSSAD